MILEPAGISHTHRGALGADEIRVLVAPRGVTDADDRASLERLARQASGVPSMALTRRCSHCGSDSHGAPAVPGLFVSLSRAADTVAFALSLSPVGIDIESVDAIARADVDGVAFTAAELSRIRVSDTPELLRAELWTAKEAVLKLRGTGLRVEPSSVELADVAEVLHPFDAGPGLVGTAAGSGWISLVEAGVEVRN